MLSLATRSNGNQLKQHTTSRVTEQNKRQCQFDGILNPSQWGPRPMRNLHGPQYTDQWQQWTKHHDQLKYPLKTKMHSENTTTTADKPQPIKIFLF